MNSRPTDLASGALGHLGTLIAGDTLVLDRWRWLKARLPNTQNDDQLLDVGCGTGAFTIGAAKRGYRSLGLTWSEEDRVKSEARVANCGASGVQFERWDARQLGERADLQARFDVVLCMETIEHVLDDFKLMKDLAGCLKPGGILLLSTPYMFYREMSSRDRGPFSREEDGWHVRRGYTRSGLSELAIGAGLMVEETSFCSGILSQLVTRLYRALQRILSTTPAWAVILPLRVIPPILDSVMTRLTGWPPYSICIVAQKPRVGAKG